MFSRLLVFNAQPERADPEDVRAFIAAPAELVELDRDPFFLIW